MINRPRVVVVYDMGSASPSQLVEAAATVPCEVVLALADTPHSHQMADVVPHLSRTIELFGLSTAEAVDRIRAVEPSGIVTFSEHQLRLTADLAAELGLPNHSQATVFGLTDKFEQRRLFAAAGLDVPRFMRISSRSCADEIVDTVRLPTVIKPAFGASSRDTYLVRDRDRLEQLLESELDDRYFAGDPTLVAEEFIGRAPVSPPWGDYLAIDCVTVEEGVTLPVFVSGKFTFGEPFRERGAYTPALLDPRTVEEATALAVRAIHALGVVRGISDVELALTPTGPQVIEVNGRLGGWVNDLAMRSYIAHPIALALRSALGLDLRPAITAPAGLPRQVTFHYLLLSPQDAISIRSLGSPAALRRIEGVDRVSLLKHPGDALDWREGTGATTIASIQGTCDSAEQLKSLVDEIESLGFAEYEYS
jgi:formate-dependent phosphoribosylglycinamide formyltransferase (GAR transformylase)